MAKDIAADTLRVGNALTSVRIDQMILNLARGIAWGQFDLDKVGVDVTRMMGVPGSVSIGNQDLSMLEAGFLPTFYQFVDTILELKMEVKVREEEIGRRATSDTSSSSNSNERGGGTGHRWKTRSSSAYSRTLDAAYAQRYNQEMNASSLMRTKLVPRPPPEVLVERIRLLLDDIRKEAEKEQRQAASDNIDVTIEEIIMEKIESRLLGTMENLRRNTAAQSTP